MEEILIRKATEKDIPRILELYSGLGDGKNEKLDVESEKENLRKIQSYPNYEVYVAEKEGRIVGTFELLIMDNLAHSGKPSAIVEDAVVDENERGGGIGKTMMQFAMEQSKRHGCYKMTLSSNLKRERAHRFYENLGFERHGYSFIVKL